jgi:hypothetical protein
VRAYDEFSALVKSLSSDKTVPARIVLAFYAHVAEGSGFYEIPKKLLLTIEGWGTTCTLSKGSWSVTEKPGR